MKLFEEAGIDYAKGNLKEQILEERSADFFKKLIHLLRLLSQLRNSITGKPVDYILSPVADEKGDFYDSRRYEGGNAPLPTNADANGAYNIARKGRLLLQQIANSEKPDMSNETWFKYAQGLKD